MHGDDITAYRERDNREENLRANSFQHIQVMLQIKHHLMAAGAVRDATHNSARATIPLFGSAAGGEPENCTRRPAQVF
jgi:hypothetical protein